ncbi:hypothetical protein [Sphingopyxis sp.]|uniref:hypothetical protein n=1 Tax=Sphingopyxis sp. TaxID=1908224 RepID=UPI001DA7FE54|nr:hypothetical protein [Sphingopyxis sp.]MBW8296298.1 hypothetical protein [Sphingopyxis sp.]
MTAKVRDELKKRYGVNVCPTTPDNWRFGSIQAIQHNPDGSLTGGADPRRGGRRPLLNTRRREFFAFRVPVRPTGPGERFFLFRGP